jgi:hypothetical protein
MVGVFAPRVYAPTVIGRGLTPNYRHEDHPQSCCPAIDQIRRQLGDAGCQALQRHRAYRRRRVEGALKEGLLLRTVTSRFALVPVLARAISIRHRYLLS